METPRQFLIALSIQYGGDWKTTYDAIKARKEPEEWALEKAKNISQDTITIFDDEYPESLKQSPRPPFVLFIVKGERPVGPYPKAYVQAEGKYAGWSEGQREARKIVISSLPSYAYAKKGYIHWVGIDGKETVMSHIPDGYDRQIPMTCMEARRIAVSMCEDAIFFEVKLYTGTSIDVAHFQNNGHGDLYVYPKDGAEKGTLNNELISQGATILML